jgi:hypothetical protein
VCVGYDHLARSKGGEMEKVKVERSLLSSVGPCRALLAPFICVRRVVLSNFKSRMAGLERCE